MVVSAARRLALRLALYLDCSGTKPVLVGYSSYKQYCCTLQKQLAALEPALKKQAQKKGRKLIREAPGLEKAAHHLVVVHPPTPSSGGKWRRRSEQYKHKMLLWAPETPPCPVCRMWGDLPKRSYPSRKHAEDILLRQNDRKLNAYECPAQPGLWHLGHTRRKKSTTDADDLTSA